MKPYSREHISDQEARLKTEQRILVLERQLDRERKGRKKVEEILRNKMMQLYQSNQFLGTMTKRLQSALWASHDIAWEYLIEQDQYYVFRDIRETSASVSQSGSFDEVVTSFHKDDRFAFAQAWHAHMSNKTEGFNIRLRHFSRTHKAYRWVSMRGKKVVEASGKVNKVIGVYKDINTEYKQELSFQTISKAFLHFKYPAFILDTSTQHIEITHAFYLFLEASKASLRQKDLHKILPINVIISNQKAGNKTFTADIGRMGDKVSCEVTLSDMLSSQSDGETHVYIVGFFTPSHP